VGVEEFILERLQVVVVQTELQLEGTISHAAAVPQHVEGLVQGLLKGHGLPSVFLRFPPRLV
jgi:hypothetical protein